MTEFPLDIIYDILSRMPVKSLARFRCVSKLWYSYIDDSYLEIMHAKQADPNFIMFYKKIRSDYPNLFYSVIELRKKPGTIEFLCQESDAYEHETVLGSCKGLVYTLYSTHRYHGQAMAVFNPPRKERYRLPPLKIYLSEESSYGLGFDDSTNTFKMVCIAFRERPTTSQCNVVKKKVLCTMVHVLGSKSWRLIHQVPSYRLCGEGVFAHGFLYWLVNDSDNWRPHNQKKPITLFDVRKEEFGLINVPKETSPNSTQDRLFDLNGQVGFVYDNIDNFTMEVWVLKHTEWVMQCQFDKAPPLPRAFWPE